MDEKFLIEMEVGLKNQTKCTAKMQNARILLGTFPCMMQGANNLIFYLFDKNNKYFLIKKY